MLHCLHKVETKKIAKGFKQPPENHFLFCILKLRADLKTLLEGPGQEKYSRLEHHDGDATG